MGRSKRYVIVPLDLATLTSEERQNYRLLTAPEYRVALEGKDPYGISGSTVLAIAAKVGEEPVALALISVYRAARRADIHSFQIKKGYRQESLSLDLLRAVERHSKKKGADIAGLIYREDSGLSTLIKKILRKRVWAAPEILMYRLLIDALNFYPGWRKRTPKIPRQFQIFPWKNLRKEERKRLRSALDAGAFPPSVSPFINEKRIEYINSLGLKHKDKIVGWVITHRTSRDTIRYSSLYVNPDIRFKGFSITLLNRAMELHQRSSIRWALVEINATQTNSSWLAFVKKRLIPYALNVDVIYFCWKSL